MTTVLLASALGSLWTVAAVLDAPPSSFLLAWFGIVLAMIDLRHHRLPDALTLPLGAALLLLRFHGLGAAVLSALVFGGAHLAVRRFRPAFMGGGDVKLAFGLGAALPLPSLLPAAILSSAVTLVVAALRRSRAVPHGPGLLAATWALTTL
ncbi:leader peptidase (prepilin peptidase) / N-methyltransferase [Lentzea waywayandensis]|uniref:Leader peptidase (Prepilin peptidase) / N-methyltransferase n=1 Tax=Lentzea waywayandensis TaxID=84724 RepID=A0A1I6CXD1_9PSEU|nr:A24 family peptidase [Lentzea waywayandensis]SFQ97791.1 leader peptidase (prepilin peptidase) / N-methyltransferase [Lentzea waywayandensis]